MSLRSCDSFIFQTQYTKQLMLTNRTLTFLSLLFSSFNMLFLSVCFYLHECTTFLNNKKSLFIFDPYNNTCEFHYYKSNMHIYFSKQRWLHIRKSTLRNKHLVLYILFLFFFTFIDLKVTTDYTQLVVAYTMLHDKFTRLNLKQALRLSLLQRRNKQCAIRRAVRCLL